ncbi:MAG: hypothetical protein Kow0068_24980 [Marinilabiliales bacterium]
MEDKGNDKLNVSVEKKSKRTGYVVIIIIQFVAIVILGYLYYEQLNKTDQVIVKLDNTVNEKDLLTQELQDLYDQYEEMKADNKQLSEQLEGEQAKIVELMEELKKVKSSSAYEIMKYKKEVNTLREIMKSYIAQIDSLNTKNQILIAENKQITNKYHEVKTNLEDLSEKADELQEKVEIASVIKAINISAMPINKRSKPTDKAKKVEKIKVCFTLSENRIVESGKRLVYIRIARPDDIVIASSSDQFFNFQGNKIVYTEKREVEYNNQELETCVYWKKDQELIEGTYYVDIFTDGRLIGETTFTLK